MSYAVTITRDPPISADEWRALVARDANLSIVSDGEAAITVRWREVPERDGMPLCWEQGRIWSTPQNDGELAKMQQLAASLNAAVVGEEGEDLTNTARPGSRAGCGATAAVALVLALILVAMAMR